MERQTSFSKRVLSIMLSMLMVLSILLNFPSGTFDISLSVLAADGDIAINAENFPDENFRNYVNNTFDTTDDDILTAAEIAAVTSIDVSFMQITDLTGVEYFTALTGLHCYANQLTGLDVSENPALTYLYCSYNQLTSLDLSENPVLIHLDCNNNQLTSLDVSKNPLLNQLYCYENQLTSLDVSVNTVLRHLNCSNNQLTSLDVKNTVLSGLNCQNNPLWKLDLPANWEVALDYDAERTITVSEETLDLSAYVLKAANFSGGTLNESGVLTPDAYPGKVTYTYPLANNQTMTVYVEFDIAINAENFPDENFRNYVNNTFDTTDDDILTAAEIAAVTSIDVSFMQITDLTGVEYFTALEVLSCYNNQLTSLDVSKNKALILLYCDNNQLTGLDVSNNTALTELDCGNNQLTGLDVSNNKALTNLSCSNNQLTSLDVSKNKALTELSCYNNQLTGLDVSKNTELTQLNCGSNVCEIDLTGGLFDLSVLPDGFDVTKASNWTNTAVDGNILTVSDPMLAVGYSYDLGNGNTEIFSLKPISCTITKDMVAKIADQTYTGTQVEPEIKVVCGSYTLVPDVDYTVSYENNTNVGDATVIITGTGVFYNGKEKTNFTIKKGIPSYTLPTDLTAVYGDTLADVALPKGFAWQDEETTAVGNAGTNKFKVTFTPNDTANYESVQDIEVAIAVSKAEPDYTIPTDLTAVYGDTLADVALPEGFAWQDEETTAVGNAGTNKFKVTFTPNDTANYESVQDIEVAIAVSKATPEVTPIIPEDEYFVGDSLPKIVHESEISGIIEWLTELLDGLTEGENELEWQFTPDDEDNYEVVTGTAVVEAQTTITTTTTSTTTSDANLPQTGYSVVYDYIMLTAAAMVLFGIYAMAKSRRKDEE